MIQMSMQKMLQVIRNFVVSLFRQHERLVSVRERWLIGHPGTGEPLICNSFDEAMDKWFEGTNIPRKLIDGKPESFKTAYDRVKQYYSAH